MTVNEPVLWGIHAGKTGDAHTLFLKKGIVALGWNKVTDLSHLPPNRDGFKAAVSAAFPLMKTGAIPINAGQLYRFAHEMKPGDFVLYPSKTDKQIHVGKVIGDYQV